MVHKRISQPYSEIINPKEIKDYKLLCDNKSEKYKYYLDWKSEMINKISFFKAPEQITNFKHYLINLKRSMSNVNASLLPIMICFLSILFSYIGELLPDITELRVIRVIVILGTLLWCVKDLVENYKDNNMRYCFYCDLIEIVNEIEEKNK